MRSDQLHELAAATPYLLMSSIFSQQTHHANQHQAGPLAANKQKY